jgi:hypothetical protein
MTDSDKIEEVRLGVARLEGSMKVIASMAHRNAEDIKKIEGRIWGVLMLALSSLGTAVTSLAANGSQKVKQVAYVVQSMFMGMF